MSRTDKDILQKRLQREAERRHCSVSEVIGDLMRALDAEQRRREAEDEEKRLAVDVLLMTATKTEHQQLREVAQSLSLSFERIRAPSGRVYFHLGRLGDNRVASIRAQMGAFSKEGSARQCALARAETGATMAMLVGTAFGVRPAQQRIGDVLVSESVFLYDDRRVVDDPDRPSGYAIEYENSARVQASEFWVQRFQDVSADQRTGDNGDALPRVFVGTLLSGGAHISSARYRDQLVARFPAGDSPIVGGEMEAAGIIASSTPDDPSWIVVKGISDFADTTSRAQIETNRITAANSAARIVLQALQHDAIVT